MIPSGVACLVPARAGSSRILDKNLQLVGGLRLLERAVRTGIEAFGEVFVSTDDEEYARIARDAGALVPRLRPAALGASTTSMDEVIQHALAELLSADHRILVLVQPTSPFTEAADLLAVVDALVSSPAAACAMTVERLPAHTAFVLVQGSDGLSRHLAPAFASARSQDVPALHRPTGGAFASWTSRLRDGGEIAAEPIATVEVPSSRALDIDDPEDLVLARRQAE